MKLFLKIVGIILIIIFAVPLWPFALGGGVAWYLWKKKKIHKIWVRYSLIAICLLFAIFAGTGWVKVLNETSTISPTAVPTIVLTVTIQPSQPIDLSPTLPIATSKPIPTQSGQTNSGNTQSGAASLYPNHNLTPGEVFPNVTAAQVCVSGYSTSVRDVPVSEKEQIFAEYGIDYSLHSNYEVDHFISLELGGDNSIKNLWPEYDGGKIPNPKDKVENYLHSEVCNGTISLAVAQQEISTDWYKVYLQMGNSPLTNISSSTTTNNFVPPPAATSNGTGTSNTGTTTTTTDTNTFGATGLCNDGTETTAIHHQGACSHHGGVSQWY